MNIFVLTGAGVSAESGLGTFRDKTGTGIWAKFDPMKLATPEAFEANPEEVHAFYNMRRHNLLQAEPNPAHFALARLEATLSERGGHLFLCTQNIDDLHERAGSRRAVHMHGELLKARCVGCEAVTERRDDLGRKDACPFCDRAGTSGSVYPAAGFMAEAKAAGIRTCEINLEPSYKAHRFDERRYGSAGEVVPAWAEEILASTSTSRFASLTATSPKRQA